MANPWDNDVTIDSIVAQVLEEDQPKSGPWERDIAVFRKTISEVAEGGTLRPKARPEGLGEPQKPVARPVARPDMTTSPTTQDLAPIPDITPVPQPIISTGQSKIETPQLSTEPKFTKHSGGFEDKNNFLSKIVPIAKDVGAEIGLDWRLIVAQSAIETGWGSKVKGNSFFGIKGHGSGKTTTFTTQEVIDGKRVVIQDEFRAYDSLEDSVRGYGQFLLDNPRYSNYLRANSLEEAASALQASGYATDPEYGRKVLQIATGKTLTDFSSDQGGQETKTTSIQQDQEPLKTQEES